MFSRLRWRVAQFLELRWWKIYLRNKPVPQYLADKKAYWQRVLDEINHTPVPGAKALDAGCGPAGIFILLEKIQEVTAIDPLLEKYERELDIFSRSAYPDVVFRGDFIDARAPRPPEGEIQGSKLQANATPSSPGKTGHQDATTYSPGRVGVGFQDSNFDVIYCFNAINHVADWEAAFDQLTAWTKPGGQLIVSSDVHRKKWLLPVFRLLPGDALHPQQHNIADYRAALSKRGWSIQREDRLRREWIFDYVCWTAVKGET